MKLLHHLLDLPQLYAYLLDLPPIICLFIRFTPIIRLWYNLDVLNRWENFVLVLATYMHVPSITL